MAKTIAKAEGKDILLEFVQPVTGGSRASDNPDPKPLLDSAVFLHRAPAAFVLLRLTLSPNAAPRQVARLGKWIGRRAVTKCPCFVLLNANGLPYPRSDVAARRVSAYQREFARMREIRTPLDRNLALARAARAAHGTCQMKPAATGIGPVTVVRYSPPQKPASPRNPQGGVARHDPAAVGNKIDRAIDEEVSPLISRRQYQAALARLDKLIVETNAPPEQRQTLLALKGEVYLGLNDKQASAKLLDQAIALDPNSEPARRAREMRCRLQK